MTAKISVVIPTYNRGDLLPRTLDSVLAQTRRADEIVVVDDGSTDDTREVVAGYGNRVRYHYQTNAYQASARNAGFSLSRGDLVCFLDSDDLLLPETFAALEQALASSPEAALAYCRSQTINEDSLVIESRWRRPDYDGEVWAQLIRGNFIRSPGCALIRRAHLETAAPFDVLPRMRGVEDWDMWLRLAERAPVKRVNAPLFHYRIHGQNVSADDLHMHCASLALYVKHVERHRNDRERQQQVVAAYQGAVNSWMRDRYGIESWVPPPQEQPQQTVRIRHILVKALLDKVGITALRDSRGRRAGGAGKKA